MLRDARVDGLVKDLYDRDFFKPLSITDSKPSINPYKPEERETILEAFKTKRTHYYTFVFFQFWQGTPMDETNFYHREWLLILRAKKIPPRPFYNTRHSYVSFLYSISASSGFISQHTGDSIRTLETDYAKYIKEADARRDFVEDQIQKSANPSETCFCRRSLPCPIEKEKAPDFSRA